MRGKPNKVFENIERGQALYIYSQLPSSVLSPLVAAIDALIESCHWLVSRSYLYLHEIRLFARAALAPINGGLVYVFPGVFSS